MAARLEYEITGSVSGLASAASQATGILNNLQNTANQLNVKLFSAETVGDINGIGGALTIVNNKIQDYLSNAIKGSQAFKDQQQITALDNLANKIQVLTGNVDIFGQSVKNSQQQITAYQSAINTLLSSGLSPFDDKITALKGKIDGLTASIEQQKAASAPIPPPVDERTLGLIEQATKDLDAFRQAKKQALTSNEINAFNQQINQTEQELRDLQNIGNKASQTIGAVGKSAVASAGGFNSFGLEIGRIAQDLPYASTVFGATSNNFGAIGNNITRAAETFVPFVTGLKATIVSEGGVVTTNALLGASFKALFTGMGGVIFAISAIVSAFTIYQAIEAKNERNANNHTNALQKQKQVLEEYIATLDTASRAASASANTYAEQSTKLDVLSAVLSKNKDALFENKGAFDELKTSFPQYFAGITQAQIGTEAFTNAVIKAKASLNDLALANASMKLANEAATSQIQNQIAAQAASDKALSVAKQILAFKEKIANTPAVSLGTGGSSGQGDAIILANLEKQYAAMANQSIDFASNASKASKELSNFTDLTAKYGTTANQTVGKIKSLQNAIDALNAERVALGSSTGLDAAQLLRLDIINKTIKADQDEIDKLEGKEKASKAYSRAAQRELTIRQQIANILAKSDAAANISGLSEYGTKVQTIATFYQGLNTQLSNLLPKLKDQEDAFNATGGKKGISPKAAAEDRSAIGSAKTVFSANEDKQLNDARIAEAQRVATEIQHINDEFGVKAQESRNAELAANDARANAEIAKAKAQVRGLTDIRNAYDEAIVKAGNDPAKITAATNVYNAEVQASKDAVSKLVAIDNGKLAASEAIDQKYIAKARQLQDTITSITEAANAELNDGEAQRTARIEAEYNKRKVAAAKSFDELRKISPERSGEFTQLQAQVNLLLDTVSFKKQSEELSKNFATALQQGVNTFTQGFYTSITSLGATRSAIDLKYDLQLAQATDDTTRNQINNLRRLEQATTTSFNAIFSKLTQSLFETFNKSIFDSFVKKITATLGTTLISPGLSTSSNPAADITKSIQSAASTFNFQTTGAAAALSTAMTFAGINFSTSVDASGKSFAASTATAGATLSKGVAGALAAVSVAGGLISGATSKTSTVGQGIGGFLSGAGTGALTGFTVGGVPGAVVGGIVGGVIGGISGIISAGNAKKAEELQKAQLAEQQKQTSLLQQQLAYTASVIGRVTAEGTLTQISIDAYGKLVATLSGKDIQLALDRTAKSRV